METTNEIQIESLINNNRQTEPALCAKLDWLRLRCLLETEACIINGVATYNNADGLMKNFITDYLKNVEGIETEENIINILKQKTKELEKEFYDFLSKLENDEKNINKLKNINKFW